MGEHARRPTNQNRQQKIPYKVRQEAWSDGYAAGRKDAIKDLRDDIIKWLGLDERYESKRDA